MNRSHNFGVNSSTEARRGRPWLPRPVALLLSPEPWKALAFILLSFVLGTAWFVLLATLVAFGGMLWVFEARLERARFRAVLGVNIAEAYRPAPEGSDWKKFTTRLGDPQTWLDLVYVVLLFPIGIVELAIAAAFAVLPFELLLSPVLYLLGSPIEAPFHVSFGNGLNVAGEAGNHLDTVGELLPAALAGAALLIALPYVLIGVAKAHAWLARLLLGSRTPVPPAECVDASIVEAAS